MRNKEKLNEARKAMWATLRAIADKPDLPGRLVYDALHDAYKRIQDEKQEENEGVRRSERYAAQYERNKKPDNEVDWGDMFPSVDEQGTKDFQRKVLIASRILALKGEIESVKEYLDETSKKSEAWRSDHVKQHEKVYA